MLSARQRCLLSSPMDCSISSFSACGSARMEFGLRVVWRLRHRLGICREPKDAPPGCKGPRRFSRVRPWTGATGATRLPPRHCEPTGVADRIRASPVHGASAAPPRNCLLEPWYEGIFRAERDALGRLAARLKALTSPSVATVATDGARGVRAAEESGRARRPWPGARRSRGSAALAPRPVRSAARSPAAAAAWR